MVDTTNFTDLSPFPGAENLHVVERLTRADDEHHSLPIHGGRSGDVGQAVVGRSAHHENIGPNLRVRVP